MTAKNLCFNPNYSFNIRVEAERISWGIHDKDCYRLRRRLRVMKAHSPSMQEQEPAGICDEMHLAPITFCFYQEKQARFSQGGSPCRWIDMGELIDSGVGGKVDPWTNEDGPDFPLDTSGPGQAFPRGSVDLSFPQVFMVDQDGLFIRRWLAAH
eukprot:g59677.t1